MGIYLGSGLAFIFGGVIIQYTAAQGEIELPLLGMVRPWQLIFFILGASGILFSVAILVPRPCAIT